LENWTSKCRRQTRSLSLIPYENKFKCIKHVVIRPKTLKQLQENLEKIHEDKGIGKEFLNRTPIAQETIPRIDRWDCIKLNFCISNKQ
jgi:hypothetical protein